MRTVVLVGLCLAFASLGACFETPTTNISFLCGAGDECPDNYECRDDGCCHLIGSSSTETCDLPDASVPAVDAPMTPDAMNPDAMNPDAMNPDAMNPDAMNPDAMAGMDPMLMSLLPAPAMVDVGQSVDFTVALAAAAPAGGTTITLVSSDPAVATVPASVTVPEGMTSAIFAATGVAPGTATVSAVLGVDQLDSTLTVAAPLADTSGSDNGYSPASAGSSTVN